jgi:hypothetical protein
MTKISVVVSAILLSLAAANVQEETSVQSPNGTEQKLIANEHALFEAVAKADKGSFLSLTHPEGVWTTKQGFVPMKMLVDGLSAYHLTKWEIVNPRVTWLGEDSAILLYSWTGTGTYGDQPLASTTMAITVWTKHDGKWLAVHHQETDLSRN